jgi:hypothetical protein
MEARPDLALALQRCQLGALLLRDLGLLEVGQHVGHHVRLVGACARCRGPYSQCRRAVIMIRTGDETNRKVVESQSLPPFLSARAHHVTRTDHAGGVDGVGRVDGRGHHGLHEEHQLCAGQRHRRPARRTPPTTHTHTTSVGDQALPAHRRRARARQQRETRRRR